jgi:hypothetical protein
MPIVCGFHEYTSDGAKLETATSSIGFLLKVAGCLLPKRVESGPRCIFQVNDRFRPESGIQLGFKSAGVEFHFRPGAEIIVAKLTIPARITDDSLAAIIQAGVLCEDQETWTGKS